MIHRLRAWRFLLLTTPVLLLAACGSTLDAPAASEETREPFVQASPPVGVPSKVVGVHFAAWETDVNIRNITQDANVIYLFNLRPHPGEVGTWYWEWPGWPSQADVQFVRARGQKVILSLGGAGFYFKFNSRAKTQATLDAIRAHIANNFGPVDGIELNTFEGEENGVKRAALSDPAEILWLIQQLRAEYGSGFALTIPPAPNYSEDLALATALANNGALTWAAPQFYDWSGFNDPGFISGRMRAWVGAIGQTKCVMGASANYPNGPTLTDFTREWDVIEAEFPNIRGAVAWNAQFNHRGGNQWTATMKERVIGTPPPPPPPPPSAKVQAESGTVQGSGVGIKNNKAGYEGTGFVGSFATEGDRLTVTFPNVTAGTYDIRIRCSAGGQQLNDVVINNGTTTWSALFPATGSSWGVKTLIGVRLAAGTNTVAIVKDWGWIDVDSIEIVPGSSGDTSTATRKQVENGSLVGVKIEEFPTGYEGRGAVGPFANAGDRATVSFTNVTAGTYDIRIRYHAGGQQMNHVSINGVSRSETFAATGSGWAIKTLSRVGLAAGTNTIAIIKDWGWIDVDYIEIGSSPP